MFATHREYKTQYIASLQNSPVAFFFQIGITYSPNPKSVLKSLLGRKPTPATFRKIQNPKSKIPMTDFWTTLVEFAHVTTTNVGKQILLDFGKVQATEKSDGSLVTRADQWADRELRDAIAANFSGYGILSEENDRVLPDNDWCWVIDPIDGTTNFTRGIPLWSISLGLLYKGMPVFGYIYVPTLGDSFHGFWDGGMGLNAPIGAFRNHHPIHTSHDNPSGNHFFNLCSRSTSIIQPDFPCKIRMLGVASYNFLTVAMGAALGGIEATPKVWDMAGVWPILQAAGASWISLKSEPFPMTPGVDYSSISFPTLILSRSDLKPIIQPFLANLDF